MPMTYRSLLNIIVVSLSATVTKLCACDVCLSGIPGELFYVRRGIVNEYALSFSIPIKNDVTEIYFVWQSLHKSPHESLVSSLANSPLLSPLCLSSRP